MFWRLTALGGLVLLALSAAVCSTGEEPTAESNDSNPRATDKQMTNDKDVIEIPLSEIWALDMPGTRDVGELEPEVKASLQRLKSLPWPEQEEQVRQVFKSSLVFQIRQSLKLTADKKAGAGFAVSAPEPELLKAVRDVLTGETKRTDSFPAGSDITAVFFSRQAESYVRIYQIERRGNEFEIRYRFVPREETEVTELFALIPLGELSSGTYQVRVVQEPMEEKYLNLGFEPITSAQAEEVVCSSFKFEVQQ